MRFKIILTLISFGLVTCGGSSKNTPSMQTTSSVASSPPGAANDQPHIDLEFPSEPFRNSRPDAGAPRPINLPKVHQFTLNNDIDVYLIEQHAIPTVTMTLVFDGGHMLDKSKVGSTDICMNLLTEGTKKLDATAYSEAQADLASHIWSFSSLESHGVTLSSLSKNFKPTFELLAETLTAPGYRQVDLKRLQKSARSEIDQGKKNASGVAFRVVDKILYGRSHPFGSIKTHSTINRIGVADCKGIHKKTIKPKGARLFVVGDTNESNLKELFLPLLKKWKGRPTKPARVPTPKSMKGKIFFVNVPGAAQSQILAVHFGPKRQSKDYIAHLIMTGALGKGFGSRINMNLREDKGYSYGARGRINYNRHYGEFVASSSVRSDSTRQSVIEIFKEIRNLQTGDKPVTAEELSREKNGEILSLPGLFGTSKDALKRYQSLAYFGMPMDYYNNYVDEVSKINLKSVNAAARTVLKPDEAFILIAGDKNAKQIVRVEKEDKPYKNAAGTQMTLLGSLKELLKDPTIGKGSLIELNADGNRI